MCEVFEIWKYFSRTELVSMIFFFLLVFKIFLVELPRRRGLRNKKYRQFFTSREKVQSLLNEICETRDISTRVPFFSLRVHFYLYTNLGGSPHTLFAVDVNHSHIRVFGNIRVLWAGRRFQKSGVQNSFHERFIL